MKHRAATAGWLSVICAGLGQLYNRQYFKGLTFILIYAAGIYAIAAKLTPHLKGIVTLGEQGQHLVKVGKVFKTFPATIPFSC